MFDLIISWSWNIAIVQNSLQMFFCKIRVGRQLEDHDYAACVEILKNSACEISKKLHCFFLELFILNSIFLRGWKRRQIQSQELGKEHLPFQRCNYWGEEKWNGVLCYSCESKILAHSTFWATYSLACVWKYDFALSLFNVVLIGHSQKYPTRSCAKTYQLEVC